VLVHERDQVCVRDEIPPGQHIVGNTPIDGPEVVEFADGPHVRLGNQLLDVGRSGRRRERRVEQTRMRDDPQIPERDRPQQVDELGTGREPFDQRPSPVMKRLAR